MIAPGIPFVARFPNDPFECNRSSTARYSQGPGSYPEDSTPDSATWHTAKGPRGVASAVSFDRVPLGRTGLQGSELALGTWRFGARTADGAFEVDRDRAFALLDAYADAGGRFLDTADTDGDGRAETWLGDWLADRERESYVIASKVYWSTREGNPNFQGLGRPHLRRQLDRILDRLGTDNLDVLVLTRWGARRRPRSSCGPSARSSTRVASTTSASRASSPRPGGSGA